MSEEKGENAGNVRRRRLGPTGANFYEAWHEFLRKPEFEERQLIEAAIPLCDSLKGFDHEFALELVKRAFGLVAEHHPLEYNRFENTNKDVTVPHCIDSAIRTIELGMEEARARGLTEEEWWSK